MSEEQDEQGLRKAHKDVGRLTKELAEARRRRVAFVWRLVHVHKRSLTHIARLIGVKRQAVEYMISRHDADQNGG